MVTVKSRQSPVSESGGKAEPIRVTTNSDSPVKTQMLSAQTLQRLKTLTDLENFDIEGLDMQGL